MEARLAAATVVLVFLALGWAAYDRLPPNMALTVVLGSATFGAVAVLLFELRGKR